MRCFGPSASSSNGAHATPGAVLRFAGCLTVLVSLPFAFTSTSQGLEVVVMTGVDTILPSGNGLNGPDAPHGAAGQNPDNVERWEWDGSDGGGENLGVLWFDIPDLALTDTTINSATLALHVDNEGDSGEAHRINVDWLSGPDGGDDVTFNNFPGGPGIVAGDNALLDVSFATGFLNAGTVYEVDVTADIQAWADGEPNYGWGFLPTAGNGTGITSFEHATNPVPTLTIDFTPPERAPDLDGDGDVDRDDFAILNGNMFAHLDGAVVAFEDGDINFDEAIDLLDFRQFKAAFPAAIGAAAGVPEPTTFSLVAALLVGICFFGRRLRSRGGRFNG